jgi:hypothetical protein
MIAVAFSRDGRWRDELTLKAENDRFHAGCSNRGIQAVTSQRLAGGGFE